MRVEGWEKILSEHVDYFTNRQFKWGETDCLIFVSDWSVKVCGKDPMSFSREGDPETIRGAYSTPEEAYDLIKRHRKNYRAVIDEHYMRVGVAYAQRGDIVYYKKAFGIAVGSGQVVFNDEKSGITLMKVRDCETAWRVT